MKPGLRKCSSSAIFLTIPTPQRARFARVFAIVCWRFRTIQDREARGGAARDQENSWRDVRGKSQERDGTRVLQPVPPLRISVAELAVFRGRQDRAHPLHGEVGRAVAAD